MNQVFETKTLQLILSELIGDPILFLVYHWFLHNLTMRFLSQLSKSITLQFFLSF